MTSILFESANVWVYLVLTLLTLFFLIKYTKEFTPEDMTGSFIILTNNVSLFFLFIAFGFSFLFSLLDFSSFKMIAFLQEIFVGLLYYWFFSYGVFFGVRLIYWFKDFYKTNDLFAYSLAKEEWNKKFKEEKVE